MSEKEPQVTFIDRRKISSDGEIRPEAAQNAAKEQQVRQTETPQPASSTASVGANAAESLPASNASSAGNEESAAGALPEGPTAQESAESNAAYQQTTQQLDDLLRAKAPDSSHLGPVVFDHLVQSMYMTAMMSMGAGTQPGEKPRVDLMGARQTIDLLGVLAEKTKGNLTLDEQRLLESALFELRMMFLEITNAIARNAANPSQQKPSGRK
ncbi:MAG TPA: DUF1844 domain-containing protein [Acidobacteriaceae bacterium]|nr:DUF1844 domain-containing protein [Acidobacteriaceae bacterium]